MLRVFAGIFAALLTLPSAPTPHYSEAEPLHGYIYETDTTTGELNGDPVFVVATCDGRQFYVPQENGLHLDQSVLVYTNPLHVTAAPADEDYLPYIRDNNRVFCPYHIPQGA